MKPRIITGKPWPLSSGICKRQAPPGHRGKIPAGDPGLCREPAPGQLVTKETVLAWKEALAQRCAPSTVNGKLAALNTFFAFLGWGNAG